MKNTILIIGIIILILALVLIGWQNLQKRSNNSSGINQANVPSEYKEAYLSLIKTLNNFDQHLDLNWNGEIYEVSYGANLLPANFQVGQDMLSDAYYNKTIAYLDALKSLGVKEIHIDIGYPLFSPDYPNSENLLNFYKKVAYEIKKRKLKLHIEISFMEPGLGHISYQGFTKEKVEEELSWHALKAADQFQPDYLSIGDEPTTINSRVGLNLNVADWTEIISNIVNQLNQKYKNIRIGAGGGTWEEEFIKSFIEKTDVDYITLHIYGLNNFQKNDFYKAIQIIQYAKKYNKKVGIGEAWAHYGGNKPKARYSNVFSFWQALDTKFMKILIKFAHYQKLEFVDPFFTNYFFVYLDYDKVMRNREKYLPPEKGLKIALGKAIEKAEKKEFTETGLAYKNAIKKFSKTTPKKTQKALSNVKVAIVYENINDGVFMERNIDETIKILKESHVDMISHGFWKWEPVFNSPDNIPSKLLELAPPGTSLKQAANHLRSNGHYYQELERWISAIKKEMPEMIFVGAIPAQTLARIEYNPITDRIYSMDETWRMALSPQKWGIIHNGKPVNREEFQSWFYSIHPYGGKLKQSYNQRKVSAYFPDITNSDFQELLLSWAERQINCGADAIWIDLLYSQAGRLSQITGDVNHPAVRDSIAAASKIVDEIHRYGKSKGRYIYVGSWEGPFISAQVLKGITFPYKPANLDFITVSPDNREVFNRKLNTKKWRKEVALIKKIYGDIPIFAFIDWSFDKSPMVIFSQKLSKTQQREFLKTIDDSFAKMGINFIYPVHGGYLGRSEITTRLAFGKYGIYDALAPEFNTYETIKELSQNKKKQ